MTQFCLYYIPTYHQSPFLLCPSALVPQCVHVLMAWALLGGARARSPHHAGPHCSLTQQVYRLHGLHAF